MLDCKSEYRASTSRQIISRDGIDCPLSVDGKVSKPAGIFLLYFSPSVYILTFRDVFLTGNFGIKDFWKP
jgi:hypothetical protein